MLDEKTIIAVAKDRLSGGLSNKEIVEKHGVTPSSVNYIVTALRKQGVEFPRLRVGRDWKAIAQQVK